MKVEPVFKLVITPKCDLNDLIASTYDALGRSLGESSKLTDADSTQLIKALDDLAGPTGTQRTADTHLCFSGLFACSDEDLVPILNAGTGLISTVTHSIKPGALIGLLSGRLADWKSAISEHTEDPFWQQVAGELRAIGVH